MCLKDTIKLIVSSLTVYQTLTRSLSFTITNQITTDPETIKLKLGSEKTSHGWAPGTHRAPKTQGGRSNSVHQSWLGKGLTWGWSTWSWTVYCYSSMHMYKYVAIISTPQLTCQKISTTRQCDTFMFHATLTYFCTRKANPKVMENSFFFFSN